MNPRRRCPSEPPSAAPSAPRSSGDFDVVICGASFAGLAVARELRGDRRPRAGARPLRDRRAPDLRLRRADGVAGATSASRPRSARPSARWSSTRPRAHGALAARLDVLDVRLPASCASCCGRSAAPAPSSRPRRSTGARGDRSSTPTAATCRAPLVVDALGWRRNLGAQRRAAARGAAVARPGGPSRPGRATTSSCGSTSASSAPATAGRSRPATRCASASARSTRATTSSSRRCALADDLGLAARRLPGQLDPAPRCARRSRTASSSSATRAGPLPAADRRGDPHRVLLRDRRRARAARRARRARRSRRGARAATARSPPRTAGSSSAMLAGPAPGPGACARARWTR